MNSMLTKRERLILSNPVDPRIVPANPRTVRKGTPWKRILADLKEPELSAIIMFCAIGLLVTTVLLLAFPHLGEMLGLYQQFF
jgi:hypothetical protein